MQQSFRHILLFFSLSFFSLAIAQDPGGSNNGGGSVGIGAPRAKCTEGESITKTCFTVLLDDCPTLEDCSYTLEVCLTELCNGSSFFKAQVLKDKIDCPTSYVTLEVESPHDDAFVLQAPHQSNPNNHAFINGLVHDGDEWTLTVDNLTIGNVPCDYSDSFTFTNVKEGIHVNTKGCNTPMQLTRYDATFESAPDNYEVFVDAIFEINRDFNSGRSYNMAGGASIVVLTGNEVKFEGADFSSDECTRLWRGMQALGDSRLTVTNCVFKDAVYAVHYDELFTGFGFQYFQSIGTSYIDNYVGIYVHDNGLQPEIESSFFTASDIKCFSAECLGSPKWVPHCVDDVERGYAGIVAHRSSAVRVLNSEFYYIPNGVISQDTRVISFESNYTSIHEPCYGWQGGYGIKYTETGSANGVTNYPSAYCESNTFNSVDECITLVDDEAIIRGQVYNNVFKNMYSGLKIDQSQASNYIASQHQVFGNEFSLFKPGVFSGRNNPKGITILTNDVECQILEVSTSNTFDMNYENSTGVSLIHSGVATKQYGTDILNNSFTIANDNSVVGIRSVGDNQLDIFENIIQSSAGNTLDLCIGVYIKGGSDASLCENDIQFALANDATGIHILNVPMTSVSNNMINGKDLGLLMEGVCSPSGVSLNTFAGDQSVALEHDSGNTLFAVTGDQFWKQNTWLSGIANPFLKNSFDRYFVPPPGPPNVSQSNGFVIQPGSSNNIGCSTTSGSGFSSSPTSPQSQFTSTSIPEGIQQMIDAARYRELSSNIANHSAEEVAFLQESKNKAGGIVFEIGSIISASAPTSAEISEIRTLQDEENEVDLNQLLTVLSSRKQAAILDAHFILSQWNPETSLDIRLGELLQLQLVANREHFNNLELMLRSTAAGCYEEWGLAVDIAAALVATYTDDHEIIEPCQNGQSPQSELSRPLSPHIPTSTVHFISASSQELFTDLQGPYSLIDSRGHSLSSGSVSESGIISLPQLLQGVYFIHFSQSGQTDRIIVAK